MHENSVIFVSGHRGMVGSAFIRKLEREGHRSILVRTRQELNLLDQRAVLEFFRAHPIERVLVAAGKVGGIRANALAQADFLYENLMIGVNLIHAAAETGVKHLLYLGSSCIYPKHAPQPMPESALLSGPLEPTNMGYAVAKIAGVKLCETYSAKYGCRFVPVMPTNLYGPGDNFDPLQSHIIPSLLRRFHEAKLARSPDVAVWGSGNAVREFLHVEDFADALYLLMGHETHSEIINIGSGGICTVREVAEMIREVVGFEGKIVFDATQPDGTPIKISESSRILSLGWRPRHELRGGLAALYQWAQDHGVLKNPIPAKSASQEQSFGGARSKRAASASPQTRGAPIS